VLYNALMATINPGDEVIIPAPLLGELSGDGGAPPAANRCRWCARREQGFKLQPDALEKAITPKTKWIILCSPSNPNRRRL